MKSSVESLLEDDHESLDQLLTELDAELTRPSLERAFELLDLFWARLAVHIRAENLHLFPALTNVPTQHFNGKAGLPTSDEAHNVLLRLRSDHDFFMKELAQMMKTAREASAERKIGGEEAAELRKRLAVIRNRLETHNHLEENQVYSWPALLFDEQKVAELGEGVKRELENLPPRFGA